jgi:SGNH hydrolase-like domain, acetyltransferase AlgX
MSFHFSPGRVGTLVRRSGALVVTSYVLVSFVLGGKPVARPAFYVLAVAGAVCTCYLHLRTRPACLSPKSPKGRWLRKGLDLATSLLAWSVLLAEGTLRVGEAWTADSVVARQALRQARLVPGHDYGAGLRGNALGYPGPEFARDRRPGVRRVAALGNSFAVGPTVPFDQNYLTLLERLVPGVEVYNFGVSGAGPREYYLTAREHVAGFTPDLVLVSLFVTHDVVEAPPPPRYLDPRQHLLYWSLRSVSAGGVPSGFVAPPSGGGTDRRPPEGGTTNHATVAPGHADEALAARIREGTLSLPEYQHLQAIRLSVCLDPPPPALVKKWEKALEQLDALLGFCGKRGVPVAFVLIPDEGQVDPAALAEVLEGGELDGNGLDLERPQRRFAAYCASRGVPCLDLLPAFRGRTDLYVSRNTHWNAAGNRLAAECLAAWLGERLPPSRPASSPPPPVP